MTRLEVRHLRLAFGGLTVTNDVSMTLRQSERVALIGPNGAGKTTFINLVSGYLRPDSGQILLDGRDVTTTSPACRVRAGLVRSFQVTRLFAGMTPRQHLALAILQRQGKTRQIWGDYRAMPALLREADGILSSLDLAEVAETPVAQIAYGRQRLLEIAIAMALRPRVLLLDEPAAGLPSADTQLIQNALDLLPPDLAVLMIDHDMDFVFRFAQRVIVLAEGAVICDGAPAQVANSPQVRRAYLGAYGDGGA